VNTNLGNLDPYQIANKTITLYLGPMTYAVNQITLRSGLTIIGSGGTILQSATSTSGLIVEPVGPIQHVTLDNLIICGYGGTNTNGSLVTCGAQQNSQKGLYLQAQNGAQNDGGVWYSRFSNLVFESFGGDSIYIQNNDSDGINQFLTFENIVAFRTQPASYSLHITGQGGQYTFINCEFDGSDGTQGQRTGGANIYIGATGNVPPYSVDFYGLTSQASALAVHLYSVWGIHFYSPHFESVDQGFYLTNGSTGVTVDSGVYITNSFVSGNLSEKGFAIYLDSTSSATFTNNYMFSADQIWVNGGTLWAWNNISGGSPTNVGAVFQAKPPSQPAPTCSSATGGMINYGAGGSGVKDWVAVCAKDATNTWAWRTIF
jgi:hypothetical protein